MNRYPEDTLSEDDGTMPNNVAELGEAVIGRRIVSADWQDARDQWGLTHRAFVITLDDGKQVAMFDTSDCCAYTDLEEFWLDPAAVDHVIMGVGTTEGYTTWHIYADYGDIMRLKVGWSCGNPFYYGYGFDIQVTELNP